MEKVPQSNMQNTRMNIDISKTTAVECEKCGGKQFEQTMLIRKLSAIVSPNGQETLVPIQAFACKHCGHVNKEFIPSEINDAI
tara:strand:- start:5 stop:253 length:249 start_codon:yes stop_codon:yes gene_type:complete